MAGVSPVTIRSWVMRGFSDHAPGTTTEFWPADVARVSATRSRRAIQGLTQQSPDGNATIASRNALSQIGRGAFAAAKGR